MPASAPDLYALIEETPAMLWRGNWEGRCVFLNRAQREFWGVPDPLPDDFQWASTLLPEDQEQVFGPFQDGMTHQRGFTCEARYIRWDGAIRVLRTKATPYFAKDGSFAGMVGVNEDVTDLKEFQEALDRRNEELASSLAAASAATSRFELATRISGLAMSEHDEDLRYTWVYNVPESYIGKTPAQVIGGAVGEEIETVLRQVLETGEPAGTEVDFLLDGNRTWVDIQASRAGNTAEGPRVIASALDVTARKLNEAKLELLAGELAHRVKNVYAVIQAVVQQSARSSGVDREFVRSVSDRLAALARAQDALLASSNDRVSVASVVEGNLGHLSRIEVKDDGATIPGRSAPYLALALHELGTNSVKYGALSHDGGRAELKWHEDQGASLHIAWSEHCAHAIAPAEKEGFGTALLTRILAAATQGEAHRELTPAGLQWRAIIPTAPRIGGG